MQTVGQTNNFRMQDLTFDWIKTIIATESEASQARQAHKRMDMIAAIQQDIATLEANAKAIADGREADTRWELASIQNSGWKDELWSLVFAAVFVGSFLPGVQDHVQVGIQQITSYPEWFRFLFSSIVLAAFGIRLWRRLG